MNSRAPCSDGDADAVTVVPPLPEMGSELPGTVAMPGAVGAGQVRMSGAAPGRGGKRRSGG